MATPSLRLLQTRLGELDCRVVDGPEGTHPTLAVVLCHGFGAAGTDLVSLAPELVSLEPKLLGGVRFVFPAAPLTLAEWGAPQGRAWWMLPTDIMQGQMRDWDAFTQEVPEGLPTARRMLMGLVDALSSSMKLPYGRIVLGGFSQGAMLTTDVALRLEEAPAGLCILSGALISEAEWRRKAAARKGLPVFQGHGHDDVVLPFQAAERLKDLLVESGVPVDFLPFEDGHTITAEELRRMAGFLAARLEAR